MKNKIGVYICHCGGNISDYININKVKEAVKNEPGVFIVKDMMFACADSAQKEIIQDIQENNLDAMVVASCSPKLHLFTFRYVAEKAKLNYHNYVQVNLREQCSWAHSDKPDRATKKGIALVRAGIAKVRYSEDLEQIKISSLNVVAIIGAGISGMRAAIELADMGTNVYLFEKDFFVGGRIAQMQELFQTDENGKEIVEKLYNEIKRRANITVFTGAEFESISGNVGNFEVKVKIKPRYIIADCDKKKLNEVIDKCTNEAPDEFNFGLTKRKAIYKNYENALPDTPVIDKDLFNQNENFLKKYNDCINLDQKAETLNFNVGAIIICSGFDPYEPMEGEYGYRKIDNVITLQQFKRIIELSRNDKLIYKGNNIKKIVFIYCVGSRQINGGNKYCSRFCCTAAVHASLIVKKKFKDINRGIHLYRDIRTYGKQEILYEDSRCQGDIFIKYDVNDPPVVEERGRTTIVKFKDLLSNKEEFEVSPDLVVLVTGMVPRKDSNTISDILKTPIGRDKFLNEVHPKLRPVETVIDGIYIAGTCQGPKNITESVKSSLAASAKANSLISSGVIEIEPTIANIDPEICEWCDKCAEICTYNSIKKTQYKGKTIATVNEATCKGCGMCSAVCPKDAIEIFGYKNKEINAIIDGLIKKQKDERKN